jgi:hypothetical protein
MAAIDLACSLHQISPTRDSDFDPLPDTQNRATAKEVSMSRSTKWLRRSTRIAFTFVVALFGAAGIARAQSAGAGPLVPSKVYLNTDVSPLYLDGGDPYTTASPLTEITCPGSRTNGCTLRVVTSFQIRGVPDGGQLYVHVTAFNKTAGRSSPYAYPNSVILLDSGAAFPGWSNHTFQWMVTKLSPGATVTVKVELQNITGSAEVEERTETIELLFN